MKIKLLNNGGFGGMEAVAFPVEVEAQYFPDGDGDGRYGVATAELYRIGADEAKFSHSEPYWWWLSHEVEVISYED